MICFPQNGETEGSPVYEWNRLIQRIVDGIDESIRAHDDEALTLRALARQLGYSEFHTTRKFTEVSGGIQLREYLRLRMLAGVAITPMRPFFVAAAAAATAAPTTPT